MRLLFYVSILCILGVSHCGVLSGTHILTQTPSAITTSQRIGGSFAYSTIESRAAPAVTLTVSSAPLVHATVPVAIPHQSIFGGSFFNPIISSPFYPGIVGGQAPVVSYPIFGGQGPILGGQGPILGGQYPGQVPVAAPPPQGVPQGPAPPPAGAVVDDDTVSVESA